MYPTLALLLQRIRTGTNLRLDELENIDYSNDEDTVFEALWDENDEEDDIIAMEYEFYTDSNGRRRKRKKPIDISTPFNPLGVEITVRRILYRAIKTYWSVRNEVSIFIDFLL